MRRSKGKERSSRKELEGRAGLGFRQRWRKMRMMGKRISSGGGDGSLCGRCETK